MLQREVQLSKLQLENFTLNKIITETKDSQSGKKRDSESALESNESQKRYHSDNGIEPINIPSRNHSIDIQRDTSISDYNKFNNLPNEENIQEEDWSEAREIDDTIFQNNFTLFGDVL